MKTRSIWRRHRVFPVIAAFGLLGACGDDTTATDAGTDSAVDTADAGMIDGGVDVLVDADLPPSRMAPAPLIQWVQPFIGSGGLGFGVGSASVAPQRPFGMIRPGPNSGHEETNGPDFYHCSGYYADDEWVWGFSQMRMHGVGIPDYGQIALMPQLGVDAERTHQRTYRARIDKSSEEIAVGYYGVRLADSNIHVGITAGERAARYRFQFPADAAEAPAILLDVGAAIAGTEFDSGEATLDTESGLLTGFAQIRGGYSRRFGGVRVYFALRFDTPAEAHGTFTDGALNEDATHLEGAGGIYLRFPADTEEVGAHIAVSFVDADHARMNLEAETESFDAMRAATEAAWEEVLARIAIEARDDAQFTRFYSALYQSLLMPTLGSDVDGSYRGVDGEVHTADFRYSTDFSLWDTFRTQVPLLSMLYPDLLADQLKSLVRMADDGGYVPRWPLGHGYTGGMVGDSADITFADALVRDVPFDLVAAYAALRPTAMGPTDPDAAYRGRRDIEGYLSRGYVASDVSGWSVSATMEFAYADAAMATLARAAGEDADADVFETRSHNWQNVWNEATGFFQGRLADGSFEPDFEEHSWQDYFAEGNARQYLWYVPHDFDGLRTQLGGHDMLMARLHDFFEKSLRHTDVVVPSPYYWQGNEPDIHAPWLFSAYGDVDASSRWTRWVAANFFGNDGHGLPGNDDSGTMSAWYVFASLGLYPIAGTPTYLYAAPLVNGAELMLPGGTLRIAAPEASEYVTHVANVTLDGATPTAEGRFSHADLAAGGDLRFDLE